MVRGTGGRQSRGGVGICVDALIWYCMGQMILEILGEG